MSEDDHHIQITNGWTAQPSLSKWLYSPLWKLARAQGVRSLPYKKRWKEIPNEYTTLRWWRSFYHQRYVKNPVGID